MMAVLGLLSLMSLIGSVLFLVLLTSRPGVSPDAVFPWQDVPDDMKLTVIRDSLTSVFAMLSFAAATVMFLNYATLLADIDRIERMKSALDESARRD